MSAWLSGRRGYVARGLLGLLAAALLLSLSAPAGADLLVENDDDARSGAPVPLVCSPHPMLGRSADPGTGSALRPAIDVQISKDGPPVGSRLCDGFLVSRVPGDPSGKYDVALDLSLAIPPGKGPFPLLVQLHGFGGGKGSPNDDALVINEAVALLRYSARGSGDSFGDMQLGDEDFEVRDIQNLVRQVVEGTAFAVLPSFSFNRKKIGVTGTSYGGGQSLMLAQSALRSWPCGPDTCELATAVPVAAWSDLVYSLAPNGRLHAASGEPGYILGVPKFSYLSYMFWLGFRTDPRYNFSNYPPFIPQYFSYAMGGGPYQDPATGAFFPPLAGFGKQFLETLSLDRSPAYQDYCRGEPVPIFWLQGWTDDLFTAHEVLRFRDVVDRQCGARYPLKVYLGNTGHPRARLQDVDEQTFIFEMIRDWLRHYLLDSGPAPALDVASAVTAPPGERFERSAVFRVAEIEDMMRGHITARFSDQGKVISSVPIPTPGDLRADPILATGGGEGLELLAGLSGPLQRIAGPLIGDAALYEVPESALFPSEAGSRTICGLGSVRLRGTVLGSDVPYAVRLWDRSPDGGEYLVDRGVFRYLGVGSDLDVTVPLHGNAWRLRPNHRLRLEVTNNDFPYLRPSNVASSTVLREVTLTLPTCEPT
ncbi:MAG: CocE/NonD family hydrolase [Actinomycetota bacterium]